MDGRTGDRPVRTKYAAVARLGLQERLALRAFVKILTRIRRHDLLLRVPAARAGQHGFNDDRAHGFAMTFDGKPNGPTIAANTPAHNCLVAVCMGRGLHDVLGYGVNVVVI